MNEKETLRLLEAIQRRWQKGDTRKAILAWLETQGLEKDQGRALLERFYENNTEIVKDPEYFKTQKTMLLFGGLLIFAGVCATYHDYFHVRGGGIFGVQTIVLAFGVLLVFMGRDRG